MIMGRPLILLVSKMHWLVSEMHRRHLPRLFDAASHPILVLDLHIGVVNRKTDAIGLASGK